MSKRIDDKGINDLALAIVEQAVMDWRLLCNGKLETYQCNFEELTYFFKHDCKKYLANTNILAEEIIEQLNYERAMI